MPVYKDTIYKLERALFSLKSSSVVNCVFEDGESPLKESRDIEISDSKFIWKYPIWYAENITCHQMTFEETARSGIWYTKNIKIFNSLIKAPKTFRRAEKIFVQHSKFPNANETLWNCRDIHLEDVEFTGDYLGINCENIQANNITINGNYAFDGSKDIVVRDSVLNSKDAFWNCENVTIINSKIIGEYLGWNSKNVTFINCEIESHQGFCYMDGVKLINCKITKSDLCFEYSKNINAEIVTSIDSIKNPTSGIIRVKEVKELIMDEQFVDPKKTAIFIE